MIVQPRVFSRRVLLLTVWTFIVSTPHAFLVHVSPTKSSPSKSSALYSNVVTESLAHSSSDNNNNDDNDNEITQKPNKLSRPERKALERQQKQEAQNANNRKQKRSTAKYELNSTAISQLSQESTPDDVMRAIKRAQDRHEHRDIKVIADFLLDECDEGWAYGYRGSLLSRLAVAALHMDNHKLARKAMETRRLYHRPGMLPLESAALIRGLLRVNNVTDAIEILDDELSLPLEGSSLEDPANQERLKHRAQSLASIASRHFFEGEPSMAIKACQMLVELGPVVREAKLGADYVNMPWLRIINGARQCESGRRDGSVTACEGADVELPVNLVYSVLNAMTTFPSDNNDDVFEALSNALVRRVLFVTGAVEMSGLPPADRGEAVFIGRSNVGKSSLVNMVCCFYYRAQGNFRTCCVWNPTLCCHFCVYRLPIENRWPL
jgi:hypothetical protein